MFRLAAALPLLLCLVLSAAAQLADTDDQAAEKQGEQMFTYRSFLASITMIIASELGDKTFFIAAILAMKHDPRLVLSAAIAALALMTVLSAAVGFALPHLLPKVYTHYASILLFFVFGARLLKDAYETEPDHVSEELVEVEMELGEHLDSEDEDVEDPSSLAGSEDDQLRRRGKTLGSAAAAGGSRRIPPILMQTFSMTFIAEWGDRSQIATIALAAQGDAFGVVLGGIIGHSLCTALAVYGGKMLASKISERSVSFVGGILFIIFGLQGVLLGP